MSYLRSIEVSHIEMTPADDTVYSSGSKKATYTLIVLKCLELCLIICCIALVDEPATTITIRVFITQRTLALCYVTFGALIIYTSIYIIMTMFGDVQPWRTQTLWSLIAFVLFVASTSMLFRDWSRTKDLNYWHPNMHLLDLVLSTACVSLVASVVYIADILVTIRFGIHGDLE